MRSYDAVIGCALAVCLVGCGSAKSEPNADAPQVAPPAQAPLAAAAQPTPAPAAAPAAPAVPVEIAKPDAAGIVHVSSSDQMRFSATRIEVSAGQKVKVEFKNGGTLPKEVMGHDLVVLKPGSDPNAFALKAMAAKATDYIPADASDLIIAHTKLLGPGESETLEFDAPAATYPFLCTFPGHVGLMNGVLVVQ